ncbi:macro domain-containing protein [Pseudescherichia vulneris]|uniref:type II toxin-antitoxin system antitoxin DNA ADP-ribosyl glycohydrolase DarG n=1 Tax=Pseudescherichia vulneris TaxID=566 RepID=UPI00227CB191|nr:macro domain-containing protein [Pseudescherichia vulneris]WAH54041.1 macro domain-containing protein [Pseudescherichia vulneris]
MITFTQGNLLDAPVEALVNTVNTVGVMGKGIALMFKERFPENMKAYALACKQQQVMTGKMFITEISELIGPRWIVNFPTKQHWRADSRMEWIEEGLQDLHRFLVAEGVKSIAIPPLGAGNGGLPWPEVRIRIESALNDLRDTEILIYEPTEKYQNVAKSTGVKKLTPARAAIAELVRRYWVLGIECSLLEIQKLAWFLQRAADQHYLGDELKLRFEAHNYGPYAHNLTHLLNALDGTYLKAERRIPDSHPLDVIWFNDREKDRVNAWLNSEAKGWLPALEQVSQLIDGFESPFGLELLATVDWLLTRGECQPTLESIKEGLRCWPAGERWANRKLRVFDDKSLQLAINRVTEVYS